MKTQRSEMIKKRSFEAAIVRAEDANADTNTVDVVFTTGHKGLRSDWSETYYEELEVTEQACDLSRLNTGAPFLADHLPATSQVLGVVERAWIENGIGKATVKLSKRGDIADIVQDVKDGILKNISVGYRVTEYTDKTEKGARYRTLLATKWQPMEISLVAIGFDPNAQTMRSDDSAENEVVIHSEQAEEIKDEENKEESQATQTPIEETQETVVEETVETATQDEAQEMIDSGEAEIPAEAVVETPVAELPIEEIRNAVSAAGLATDFADQLIERKLSMAEASTEIFKKLETKQVEQNQTAEQGEGKKQMEKRQMVIEALMYRADAKKFKCSEGNDLKGKTLVEIFEQVVPRKERESAQEYVKRAIVSADLADVLSNAANKMVQETFVEGDFAYKKLAAQKTLKDFKATPIVQLSAYGLNSVTEGGDYQEASLTDSKEEITLRQRGILLILSLKAIINDDLNVLEALPSMAQKAGGMDVENAFFGIINANAALSDGVALFHATHGNLITDADVDVDSMALAEQALAEQTGLDGNPLGLKPKFILCAPALAFKARQVVGSMLATSSTNFNPYAGSGIEVVVSDLLTDKDSWYVFADPAFMPAIVTGTLEGMDTPQVAVEEAFKSSNMQIKVEYHNAAKGVNYQGAVKLTLPA